jgi:ribosomal protein L44E
LHLAGDGGAIDLRETDFLEEARRRRREQVDVRNAARFAPRQSLIYEPCTQPAAARFGCNHCRTQQPKLTVLLDTRRTDNDAFDFGDSVIRGKEIRTPSSGRSACWSRASTRGRSSARAARTLATDKFDVEIDI